MMRVVYVFGNPLVGEDSLALRVAERVGDGVEGVKFVPVQSLDEAEAGKELWVLDVAEGVGRVELLEGLELLEAGNPVSGHDFDLALELKLLHKLGRLGRVRIIAIPKNWGLERAVAGVLRILRLSSSLP